MTARELIQALAKLPVLDVELKLNFSYYTLDGMENEHVVTESYTVTDVANDGILKTYQLVSSDKYVVYDTPEPPDYDDDYIPEDDNSQLELMYKHIEMIEAWEEYDNKQLFANEEEEQGYNEYADTLIRQDADLEELVKKARENAEETLIDELNSDLDCWL